MSERDLLDGLNDSLSIEDLMRVPESQGLAEQNDRLARLRGEPGAQERSIRAAPDLDEDFVDKIKGFEGYKEIPEWDYRQYSSGWGTRAQAGERPSREEHERRLRNDLGKAAEFVDTQVPELPEGVRKAMISLTYNAGGDWAKSGLGAQLRQGDYEGAQRTFLQYNKAGGQTLSGLQDRRTAEAAWFGPGSYDTEDRTAVGLGGSRAYAPEIGTVPDTGRRQMANGEPRGIMDFLTGGQQQQQQPGGLLGMLGDPETMSYIAMMLKGASPYSNLDPNAMLSNAHTIAMRKAALEQQRMERMTDNQRADRALNLRESELGLSREERKERADAAFEERQQKRDIAAKQKEIDDEVRRNLGGGAPADPTVTAVPEGTRSAEDQIAQLNRELAKNPSPHIAKSIERRIEQLQKQETDKAIPAELAGRLGMADVYLKKAPEIAKHIDAGDLTGLIDQPLAKYGGALGGKSAEIYRDMQSGVDALTRMMTGAGMPASEAEAYANRYLPALTDNATSLRSKHDRLVEELQTIKRTAEKGRVRSPGASPSDSPKAPDSGALPGGWTVKVR